MHPWLIAVAAASVLALAGGCSASDVSLGTTDAGGSSGDADNGGDATRADDGGPPDTGAADGPTPSPDACAATPVTCATGFHWDATVCGCTPDICPCPGGTPVGPGCHCGGNIAGACKCAPGLTCFNDAGGPTGDIGGFCVP
jgi:hypothetical protein